MLRTVRNCTGYCTIAGTLDDRTTTHSAAAGSPRKRLVWLAASATLPAVALTATFAGCPSQSQVPLPTGLGLAFNAGTKPTPVVATGEPFFRAGAVFEQIAGQAGSHAPTVAALPNGELLAAWYSYDGPGELDGAAIYMARWSPAAGWSTPWVHIDRPAADGNPVLYTEGEHVWLFQAVVPGTGWSTAHVEAQHSFDGGQTWTDPRVIPSPLGTNVRHPPIRLTDGTLLLPAYDDLLPRSLFFASADGESWSLRSVLAAAAPHNSIQPSVTQIEGGGLLAVMRNSGRGWLWVSGSDDAGRTWTVPADAGFPNPASPAVLVPLASGNLILIYNEHATDRRPLSITASADDGATWNRSRTLVTGDGEYAYAAAVQTADGTLHILYSHDRQWIGHLELNEAWLAAP